MWNDLWIGIGFFRRDTRDKLAKTTETAMSVNSAEVLLADPKKEEKQLKMLERQWALLEVIKKLRIQIPILFTTLNFVTASFIISHPDKLLATTAETCLSSVLRKALVCFAIFIFAILGLLVQHEIHAQYKHHSAKIDNLYEKLRMTGPDFSYPPNPVREQAFYIFFMGYAMIVVSGIFSIISVCIVE